MSYRDPDFDTNKGIIAWFTRNPVAAGLLMALIIASGLYSAFTIKKEIMPVIETRVVKVMQAYPGASPSEVEQGIVLKIEEAIKDLSGIKRIESHAYDSLADIAVEVEEYYDVDNLLNDVKIQVDSIATFPVEAERPVISRVDWISHAVQLQLHGVDETNGKWLSEEIKQELMALDGVGKIRIYGTRDREITIEVDEPLLRKYGLTLGQVAQTVASASVDVPAGSIRASSGDILLRTRGQAYDQKDFERIVLLTWPDGTRLTLGDIAGITDGFVEAEGFAMFDGAYSIGLVAYAMGEQDVIQVSRTVKAYIERKAATLPEGVTLDYWADTTFYLNQRLSMMLRNLGLGALLVFLTLAMFLELRMAFWVMLGLPICFLGTLALMPLNAVDISINMLSLFGFILVLGIVVDDAIIIGESVHATTARHGHTLDHVILGAQRVAMPATFGVLTTIAAFAPTLFVDGIFANMMRSFGLVVILCLLFSLLESKWILPAHLAHINEGLMRRFYWPAQDRLQQRNNARLDRLIERYYEPLLRRSLRQRYITVSIFLALMIVVFGLIGSGWIRYVMVADNAGDYLQVDLEMARGTPDHKTLKAIASIQEAFAEIEDEYKDEQGSDVGFAKHLFNYGLDGRIGFFMAELTHPDRRAIDAREIIERWREKVGQIPGARVLSFTELDRPGAKDLEFNLVGKNALELEKAAGELSAHLAQFEGVYDIENGAADLVNEIHLEIKPSAQALGLTLADLGRQVRDAFHGAEVQRLQRGNDEIKVLVRYPRRDRTAIANLENMYIRGPDGGELPLLSVAELSFRPAPAQSLRINREAAIPVTAQVDKALLEPRKVVAEITGAYFNELSQKYPSVRFRIDGDALESTKMESSMMYGFALSLFAIYALLAVPLRSYLQPLMVMCVIPFGVIGAAIGHVVMGGMPMSMMSLMGIIALSGVVVNDSLILVDFVNRGVRRGVAVAEAVVQAARRRFRAIFLTSMTTFLGILPILLEPRVEAQFLVPMAVALGFGIVFSTVISLLLVPNLYLIREDFRFRQGATVPPDGEQLDSIASSSQ